jgi:pimeloyl-ACP methyl ester carboxylesterase
MRQPLVEHRLELAGFDTRALELEGDGPPLVLLHGFADSADTWRLVLDRLARQGRRAIALDLPGFATATRLEPGLVLPQLDAFAAAAVRHAAEEAGEPAVVAGNSLGGCMALRAVQDAQLPLRGAMPVSRAFPAFLSACSTLISRLYSDQRALRSWWSPVTGPRRAGRGRPGCRQRDSTADAPVASIGRWSRLPQALRQRTAANLVYEAWKGRDGTRNLRTLTDLAN